MLWEGARIEIATLRCLCEDFLSRLEAAAPCWQEAPGLSVGPNRWSAELVASHLKGGLLKAAPGFQCGPRPSSPKRAAK